MIIKQLSVKILGKKAVTSTVEVGMRSEIFSPLLCVTLVDDVTQKLTKIDFYCLGDVENLIIVIRGPITKDSGRKYKFLLLQKGRKCYIHQKGEIS